MNFINMPFNYTLIIPHYNIPILLRRLLSTIPNRNDLQIIVVDDCSTENRDELEKVKHEYSWVEWYDTGSNGGGGKARNIGLQHAKGKYLIFADSDDFFNLCFNEALDKYKDSNNDIIYFAANSVDTDSYQTTDRDKALTLAVNKFLICNDISILRYQFTNPWCKFISHKLVRKNGISFQESPVYNDMHFSQQVDFYASSYAADPNAIYCITMRKDSVSCVSNPEKEIEKVKVMINFYNFYKNNGINFNIMGLIAPTYFNLVKINEPQYAKRSLKMWMEAGIPQFKIIKCLIMYRLRILPHILLRRIFKK